MPLTVAVIGATGKTGREVVRRLLEKEDVHLRLYVRSLSKLLKLFPSVSSHARVSVFVSCIEDVENMTKCLDTAQKIVLVIGENDNIPGVSIIETAAKSVLAALTRLSQTRSHREWQRPRIIMLSSGTWNPKLSATQPALIHWAVKTAFCHAYADLLRGQDLLLQAADLATVLLVQPNALIEDEANGHEISTDEATMSVTYGDLGAGFVDLVCDDKYDAVSAVAVSSRKGNEVMRNAPTMVYAICRGLCSTFVPGFWAMNRFCNAVMRMLTWKRGTD